MSIKTSGGIVNIPWAENEDIGESESGTFYGKLTGRVNSEPTAYQMVPLIYRAIRLRCNGLTRVPIYIYKGKYWGRQELDAYQFEDSLSLHDLLWLSEASILLHGAAYILKKANVYGYKKELQWVNPFTIQTQMVNGEMRLWQQLPTGERFPKEKPFWTLDDFLYMRDFNPLNDVGPGVSATSVALVDGQILSSVSQFLSNFFTADALPVTLVTIPPGTQATEIKRIENWFRNKLTKMRRAVARVLAISGDVKVEKLTAELKTFAFDQIDVHAIQNISWAFDVPKTVLTADSANRATADTEYETFVSHTIIPRTKFYENLLNPFLAEFGQRIEFAPEELPEMQTDEAERADSLNKLTTAGMPLRVAMDVLGYDLSEEAQIEFDKEMRKKEEAANKPPPIPQQEAPGDGQEQPPQGTNGQGDVVKAELDRWMRKALKRVRSGKGAQVDFESDVIEREMKYALNAGLLLAKNEEQVRKLFKEKKSDEDAL